MLKKTFFSTVPSSHKGSKDVDEQRANKKKRLMAAQQTRKKSPEAMSSLYGQYMAYEFPEDNTDIKVPLTAARHARFVPETVPSPPLSEIKETLLDDVKQLMDSCDMRASVCRTALLTALHEATTIEQHTMVMMFHAALIYYMGVSRHITTQPHVPSYSLPVNRLASSMLFIAVPC